MLTIKIKTGGSAYKDDDGKTDMSFTEIKRNLREVAGKLEYGYVDGNIIDINGNVVGTFELEE